MNIQMSTENGMRLAVVLAAGLAGAMLSGCGLTPGGVPTAVAGSAFQGSIHGGQQAVSGSTVQLYAVGSSGYGSAATPLLTSTVLSQSDGSFSISNKYTCPSASTQVYITATAGNSGFSNNPNLAMMAALGPCGNLTNSTFIFINELTTVASVWALSPFMNGPTAIGSTSANATGLANAAMDVATLVNTSLGTTPGPGAAAGATVPSSEINTLGDILAACINTGGGTSGDGTPCGNLFNATKVSGVAPTDTITAAMNIAQHPAVNVATLYGLVTGTAPFQPTLSTQPNDFTIAVNYVGGGLNTPAGLAVDASGNIWMANSGNNTVSEFASNGSALSGTGYTASFNTPSSIAIDATGNAWITNKGNNTVSRLTSSGAALGSPLTGGGLNVPSSISFDSVGNAWVANAGNASVSAFSSAGTAISGASGYAGSGITAPIGVAVSPH